MDLFTKYTPDNNLNHPDDNLDHPDNNLNHPADNLDHPDNNLDNPDDSLDHPDDNLDNPDDLHYNHPDHRSTLHTAESSQKDQVMTASKPSKPLLTSCLRSSLQC